MCKQLANFLLIWKYSWIIAISGVLEGRTRLCVGEYFDIFWTYEQYNQNYDS